MHVDDEEAIYTAKMAAIAEATPKEAVKIVQNELREIIKLDPMDEVGHFQLQNLVGWVSMTSLSQTAIARQTQTTRHHPPLVSRWSKLAPKACFTLEPATP